MMDKIRLLIADKSPLFLQGLQSVLENEPNIMVISVCCTGEEVIKKAKEYNPDVIMIGSELSGCGDIDIIQNIHIEMPKINIIALSSSEKIEEFICCIRDGAKGYISKNSSTESFVKIISLIADGDVIISPPLATKLLEEFTLLEKYEKDTAKIEDSKKLSKREQEVLSLVAQGFSNKEIAEALFISEQTVKTHMRNVMAKLHLHNRMRAIIAARATQPFPNDKNQVEN